MVSGGLIIAAGISSAVTLVPGDAVVDDGVVRLSDVADISLLPEGLRERAGKVALAVVDQQPLRVTDRALFDRARSLMPALGPWLPKAKGRILSIHRAPRGEQANSLCLGTSPSPNVPGRQCSREIPGLSRARVAAGQSFNMRVVVGTVSIEHSVIAMQPAWAGQRLFVRGTDGDFYSTRYMGEGR